MVRSLWSMGIYPQSLCFIRNRLWRWEIDFWRGKWHSSERLQKKILMVKVRRKINFFFFLTVSNCLAHFSKSTKAWFQTFAVLQQSSTSWTTARQTFERHARVESRLFPTSANIKHFLKCVNPGIFYHSFSFFLNKHH